MTSFLSVKALLGGLESWVQAEKRFEFCPMEGLACQETRVKERGCKAGIAQVGVDAGLAWSGSEIFVGDVLGNGDQARSEIRECHRKVLLSRTGSLDEL